MRLFLLFLLYAVTCWTMRQSRPQCVARMRCFPHSATSSADVADFMLNQMTDNTYMRSAPGVSS
jgi:hypothetical protein